MCLWKRINWGRSWNLFTYRVEPNPLFNVANSSPWQDDIAIGRHQVRVSLSRVSAGQYTFICCSPEACRRSSWPKPESDIQIQALYLRLLTPPISWRMDSDEVFQTCVCSSKSLLHLEEYMFGYMLMILSSPQIVSMTSKNSKRSWRSDLRSR